MLVFVLALALIVSGCVQQQPNRTQPRVGTVAQKTKTVSSEKAIAIDQIIASLFSANIPVLNSSRESGMITTGKVFIEFRDRTSTLTDIRCGGLSGSGGFAWECMDFIAEYQILVQDVGQGSSRISIRSSAVAVDWKRIPRATVSEGEILDVVIAKITPIVYGGF